MKSCLSDLYRKVSKQIRHEMHLKDAENKLKLYRYYIPLIVNAISESIDVSAEDLTNNFLALVNRHIKKEISHPRSLRVNGENRTVSEEGQAVRGQNKSSRSKKMSVVEMSNRPLKNKRVDTMQEKIEDFMTPSKQLD
jgi:hypothetical protein